MRSNPNQHSRSLYCPIDGHVLATRAGGGVDYHSCEKCSGIWVPGYTLERVFQDPHFDFTSKPPVNAPVRQCAGCQIPLQAIEYYGVVIDHCRHCKGVWLDKGEMRKLRSVINQKVTPREARQSPSAWEQAIGSLDILEVFAAIFDW
ncbi:zf-TFIIB domain-containing protein [Cerasicoccus arenae]|uniref:TFIIB-type zinc ribbon-containing protein n=1 Tax=Cerasicoccus arenae TaxID=424488 RepID=UPI001678FD74|nr:zf-TFIIB domain-containing protein [Cerasicoccus arenae]MBK1859835.1 zf-TFIIB domain-containing protein [Cerasicoccus arenae]